MFFRVFALGLLSVCILWGAELGKVNYVEGQAWLIKKEKPNKLRMQQKVFENQKIRTGAESIVEIVYRQGSVVRIGENSEVLLTGNQGDINLDLKQGRIWANVQKMTSGADFRVRTSEATAAVRGTVFRVDAKDSSSEVALYQGKVDVGPSDTTQIQSIQQGGGGSTWGPPTEVPGPYEVTLESWIHLDPGKQIHVQWNGRYATSDLNHQQENQDSWIRFNQQRDQSMGLKHP